MLARAVIADRAPFPLGSGPLDPLILAIFSWTILAFALFAGVLFLAMTMERREAEQRGFAMSDPLTGLLNRRAFADFTQRLSRRAAGGRGPVAMLVLDIDNFKQVNDCFGHDAGDRMLKAFADMSEGTVRPTDQLFRMGGEEFCFVLPDTALADAIAVAERLRRAFEAIVIDTVRGPATTTVSIGIAAASTALDVDVLYAAADAAAYEAKARGRNRVVVAEPATLLHRPADVPSPLRRSA
jgi:diguanylate cyclase (GGDEF)-like protein